MACCKPIGNARAAKKLLLLLLVSQTASQPASFELLILLLAPSLHFDVNKSLSLFLFVLGCLDPFFQQFQYCLKRLALLEGERASDTRVENFASLQANSRLQYPLCLDKRRDLLIHNWLPFNLYINKRERDKAEANLLDSR